MVASKSGEIAHVFVCHVGESVGQVAIGLAQHDEAGAAAGIDGVDPDAPLLVAAGGEFVDLSFLSVHLMPPGTVPL